MKKVIAIILAMFMLLASFAIAEGNETGIGDNVTSEDTSDDTVCAADVQECQDGSFVSRNPENDCEFDECPAMEEEVTEEEMEEADEEAINDETEEEIEIIAESSLGADLRILQLKRAVTNSYMAASNAISILEEKGEDVSELEAILAEMEIIKEEVSSLDPASETAVEDYVAIKRDIISLNQDFRKIAGPLLTANEKKQIRDAVKNSDELESIHDEIRNANMALNANRVQNMLRKMGVENPELIQKIESGDATPEEVVAALKEAYADLTPEQRKQARHKVKDSRDNRKVVREKIVEKVKLNHAEIRRQRLKQRLDAIPAKLKEKARARIEKTIHVLERVAEDHDSKQARKRLKDISEEISQKRQALRDRFNTSAVPTLKERRQITNERVRNLQIQNSKKRVGARRRAAAARNTKVGDTQ